MLFRNSKDLFYNGFLCFVNHCALITASGGAEFDGAMTDVLHPEDINRPARTSVMTKIDICRNREVAGSARVRNLSEYGLGGVSSVMLDKGEPITVEIKGAGRVFGTVAWVEDGEFGMKFDNPIDPASLKMTDVANVSLGDKFSFKQRYQPVADYKRPGFQSRH